MPYINVKITDEGVTKEQKQAIIKGCTQLMVDVLNKNPETTVVVIDEISTDNWGVAGELVTEEENGKNRNECFPTLYILCIINVCCRAGDPRHGGIKWQLRYKAEQLCVSYNYFIWGWWCSFIRVFVFVRHYDQVSHSRANTHILLFRRSVCNILYSEYYLGCTKIWSR